MKILLSDQVIETPVGIEQGVQVVRYDGQTFDELLGIIVGLATEPFDLAIVVNNNLANVIPFFDETIVVGFKGLSELKSVSFYGDNFTFTNKYIEFFGLLQQELEIDVYYAGRRGFLRGGLRLSGIVRTQPEPDVEPEPEPVFFVASFYTLTIAGQNNSLFNECNNGCWQDKNYFINAANVSHKLHGDLTIDYTGNYANPIPIDGVIFDGCGHTITLNSNIPIHEKFFGLFDFKKGAIINVNIKVNTKFVTLGGGGGWLCEGGAGNGGNNITCLIDNCHVYADLYGTSQGGLVGSSSFKTITGNSTITIQNCSFTGDIGNSFCGGIVGQDSLRNNTESTITIKDCKYSGKIVGTYNSGIIGGGYSLSFNNTCSIIVSGCNVFGDIDGTYNSGVIGINNCNYCKMGTKITIQNCHFVGNISGKTNGGVINSGFTNCNTITVTISDCSSSGNIDGGTSGGVIGENFGYGNTRITMTIRNCRSIGDISGDNHSGVIGHNSCYGLTDSTITITDCSSSGNIDGNSNGGVIGSASCHDLTRSTITIGNCSSTGNISGEFNGGVIGNIACYTLTDSSTITISNCSSTGNISGRLNGGVIGRNACYALTNSTITISNCSSVGTISGEESGGFVGQTNCHDLTNSTITISNCSSTGNISGTRHGGVVGLQSCYKIDVNSTITVADCRFSGDVRGIIIGGIFAGANSFYDISGKIMIQNCIVSGDIYGSRWGGIVGYFSFKRPIEATAKITIQNCYSFCNFLANSLECGGIIGPFCGYNPTQQYPQTQDARPLIKDCYSTGTNLGTNSYAILGYNTVNCDVLDCTYNSYYETIAGSDYTGPNTSLTPILNNTYTNTIGLPNIAGRLICNTAQIIRTPYECPLHLKVLNTGPYQKQNKNLTVVAAFGICKPITISSILTFILNNVCNHEHLFIYSKDMKFKSPLYWDNNNAQYNGTLASGTYIIVAKRRC